MTDFDKRLIEKANRFNRWDYSRIDTLISIADTKEGAARLYTIKMELRELAEESI